MLKKAISFLKQDEGQGMVEYGLIIALIAIAVIGAITFLGAEISGIFKDVGNRLDKAGSHDTIDNPGSSGR